MSTAIAHWKVRDARKEIFGLVDQVRAKGFFIDKDFILKACLYLYSGDIRYKISNFSEAQVKRFEQHWDQNKSTVLSVFDLVRDFGFDDVSLTSNNAPVANCILGSPQGISSTDRLTTCSTR